MWRGERYYYTIGTLKSIAHGYRVFITNGYSEMPNPYDMAEVKADFDSALNRLGQGHWVGNTLARFKSYTFMSSLQKVIIADILRVNYHNKERKLAYNTMRDLLNGKEESNRRTERPVP